MTHLLSSKKNRIITFLSLIFIGLFIVATMIILVGTKNSNETENKEMDTSLSNVPDYYSNGKNVEIDGLNTGLKLNHELEYNQSQVNVNQCNDSTDSGYLNIKFSNQENLDFYLLNKKQLGETIFMDYYNRFAGKIYSEQIPELSILHTYCGELSYAKLINNIENYSVNSTNYLNIVIGGYQYMPAPSESVILTASFHAYNPNNLVQVDFTLPELFKYEDVENYKSCLVDEISINVECFSELLNNNPEKMNQINNASQDIINKLNIYFE